MAKKHKREKEDHRKSVTAAEESVRPPDSSAAEEFNFDEYKKAILANPQSRRVVEDFLKWRHREWEENLVSPLTPAKQKLTR